MPIDAVSKAGALSTGPKLSRRDQLIELSVFLLLIVPSMVLSLFVVRQGAMSFVLTAWAVILRDLGLVALVLFFLWRNREPLISIGWQFDHWGRELILGAALFLPFHLLAGIIESALLQSGLHAPAAPPPFLQAAGGPVQSMLGLLLVAVVAVGEETIFRGYLILRFASVISSPAIAVVLSAFVFSLGHGYEGSAGLITVLFMGIVFGLIYLWRGSLIAPMAMHFLQDFIGIVALPVLGGS